ncbi:MAG TPA: ribose-phosphate pyrophosphokinase [Armatimonadota bacterium]|jgi:ribose-phosphate pyrophosphokinase
MKILTGNSNRCLAEEISQALGVPLARLEIRRFSDGEVHVRLEESVRGNDVFIIQSTSAPVNEHLMELLIMLDALKRASTARTTVVMPYYGYARQDKKVRPREPVSAKLVTDLLQVAGADRLLTIDLHADQIQAFFDGPVDHLYARPIIAQYLTNRGLKDHDSVVVSPDVGGVARARRLAENLQAPIAIITKRRPEPNRAEVMEVVGEVKGKRAVIIDDMVDTAGSLVAGAVALKEMGATQIFACCTHGVLSGPAVKRIEDSPIEELVVTNTIRLPEECQSPKVKVLSVAPLLADAMLRIHDNRSVSELFTEG